MDSANATVVPPDAESAGGDAVRLKQGDTVAGRFVVDECLRTDALGPTWRAVDQKSGKRVEILILSADAAEERAATERLRTAVKNATRLVHKNVVGSFGMGREGSRRYLVREFVDGQTLADLLDKKAQSGRRFSLKGAYNLVAHVCNALAAAAAEGPHGTLRPSAVLINRTGRVKVGDFGLAELRPYLLIHRESLPIWDRAALLRGKGDDAVVVGVLLFSLLAGRPPRDDEFGLPAEVRTEGDEGVDRVVRRVLSPKDPERLTDPAEIKAALAAALPPERADAAEGDPADASTELPPGGLAPGGEPGGLDPSGAAAAGRDAGDDADDEGAEDVLTSSAPIDLPARPKPEVRPRNEANAAGRGEAKGPARPDAAAGSARPNEGRPGDARSKIKASAGFVIPELRKPGEIDDDGTARRWLVERDGTDYGPYARKEIIDKLFSEEITPQTVIYDVETDLRTALAEFAAFEQVLLTWSHEKAERERRRSEESALAAARRRTRILGAVAAVLLLGIGGTAGGWAWYKSTLPAPVKAHLASLVTPIQGALPAVTLPEEVPETEAEIRERREKEAAAKAATARRNELAARSREANLAASTEVDVAAGGDGTFDRAALDRQLAARQGALIRCLQDEVRRNPSLKSTMVKGTVVPNGELINVSLQGGSDRGTTCARQALRGIRVPAFAGGNQAFSQPFDFE